MQKSRYLSSNSEVSMCGLVVMTGKIKDKLEFEEAFSSIRYRGPDMSKIVYGESKGVMAFHRLAIMDLRPEGMQPFKSQDISLVCNGEIYNHRELKTDYVDKYNFSSDSDCEVILPLFIDYGIKSTCEYLDGEFAFVIKRGKEYYAGRDPLGIRPLFYGKSKFDDEIAFASEMKALVPLCDDIKPFPPGHYYESGVIKPFFDVYAVKERMDESLEKVYEGIHDHLVDAVRKRLDSDAPVGFLLSGGLDSSLVCAIAAKLSDKPIKTFAVGVNTNPIDLKYARIVADYLGTEHHEVTFTKEEMLAHLPDLVDRLETWDITTIRAAMGMSKVCEYIRRETDVKVVLTGEVSDELFGYKYTDYAPSAMEFQKEAQKRIKELYMYDVLRADRSISSHSLEARVPFSDKSFVKYVMGINAKYKMNWSGEGKYILRKAFDRDDYLPQEILFREKAAFSDAVGHDLVDWLKEYAESKYTEEDLIQAQSKYEHATPFTKESLLYRDIFEEKFSGLSESVVDFWMPNKEWDNCNVKDPSARVLPNYGESGS